MGVPIAQGAKLPSGGYEVDHGTQVYGLDRATGCTEVVLDRRRRARRDRAADLHDAARPGRVAAGDSVRPSCHPQPRPGRLAPRAGADPGLRAVHHRRRRVAVIWLGERRWVARGGAPAAGRRHRALGGARSGSSAPGSTTCSPTPSSTSARAAHPSARSYVWQGGLGIWGAIAVGAVGAWIGCRRTGIRVPAARRRARAGPRCWPRRSDGGATTSTRSSSAGPPRCRGRWRSTPAHRPPGYPDERPSTRRSSTSRSGTSASPRAGHLGRPPAAGSATGARFALYVVALHAGPRAGSRSCGSTPCSSTTCSGCG